MVLGVLVTLALGIGLMALVFISSRRGYDEPESPVATAVDRWRSIYHLKGNPSPLRGGRPDLPPRPVGRLRGRPMPMKKETQYHAWYWIVSMLAVMAIQMMYASYTQIAQVPYSEFQDDLKAGKIAEVRVSGNYIQGKFKDPTRRQDAVHHHPRRRPDGAGAVEI